MRVLLAFWAIRDMDILSSLLQSDVFKLHMKQTYKSVVS